jgi:hypothetical protein
MGYVGYQYVKDRLALQVAPIERPASVRPVTRIEPLGTLLAVPAAVAPGEDLIEHLLFALKHEGTNLQLIAAASEHLEAARLVEQLRKTPTGAYARKLALLYETFTGRILEGLPAGIGGVPHALFDPTRYVVNSTPPRDKHWRIDLNGLGDFSFCPVVRRTPQIEAHLATDLLKEVREFLSQFPKEQLDRVLAWAYLHETRSSYEIEGEHPSASKAQAFAALLRQAHEKHPLDEGYFVTLQNAAITNPLGREASFRQEQNYLSNGAPGAVGVSYVPPPAIQLESLIGGIARMANLEVTPDMEPLVRAALVSFGFVFAHPFLDGNGRLSRFLAHYALCQSGALPDGTILPLSTAMKRNETDYLKALQSVSSPLRALWSVHWLDAHDFDFKFLGNEAVYRFWDATACVDFIYCMAREALRKDLRGEVAFLACYDQVVRSVNERYDVSGSTLTNLILMVHQNGGVLSKNRRKQFLGEVEDAALNFIESSVKHFMQETGASENSSPSLLKNEGL